MSGTDDTNSGSRFVGGRTCDMLVPLYMLKLSAVAYFYRHKGAYSDWTTARFTLKKGRLYQLFLTWGSSKWLNSEVPKRP